MIHPTLTTDDREWLTRVLARPEHVPTRLLCADALRRAGDELRANVVGLTARALEQVDGVGLGELLVALPAHQVGWARLVGATLVSEMEKKGLSAYVRKWMPHALPALSMELEPATEEPAIGSSFFWGDPDLPEGAAWPTLGDCFSFFGDTHGIDRTSKCHFIAQFALADVGSAVLAPCGLTSGLLSVFAFQEYDQHGISEVAVLLFPDATRLRRVPHPILDEANSRRPCHRVTFDHVLTIPERDERGPWAQEIYLAEEDDRDPPGYSAHRDVLVESGGGRGGLFGHLRSTTGGDPTPDRAWQRLFCVPGDPDRVVWHHVAIRRRDLAAGSIAGCRSVWVDLDG